MSNKEAATSVAGKAAQEALSPPTYLARPGRVQGFWRNRLFARVRHHLTWMRRLSPLLTRAHAVIIQLSGGRIRHSFVFTGGMPILVITTTGRRSGQRRSTPLGYLEYGYAFAVLASDAGSDRTPAWWLNLQADPRAELLANGTRRAVRARQADAAEDEALWKTFAGLNPGFDEYRRLTERPIPVVILAERSRMNDPLRACSAGLERREPSPGGRLARDRPPCTTSRAMRRIILRRLARTA